MDSRAPRSEPQSTRVVDASFRSSLGALRDYDTLALSAAALARDADRDGHALLVVATWLDDAGRPCLRSWLRTAVADGPIAVAVGAHPACDVGPIAGASLRHVLLIVDPQARGPLLDVVDLCTPSGFRADGQLGVRRVETLVAQRLGLGSADLCAVVLEPGEGVREAWARAADGGILSPDAQARTRGVVAERVKARAYACEVSVQSPVSPEVFAFRPPPPTQEGVTRLTGRFGGDGALRITPTREELEQGFLIGRYDRCGLTAEDALLSRVHAFVRARGDRLLVCDAGSTNGTWVIEESRVGAVAVALDRGHRARVVRSGTRLRCGETEVVVQLPTR